MNGPTAENMKGTGSKGNKMEEESTIQRQESKGRANGPKGRDSSGSSSNKFKLVFQIKQLGLHFCNESFVVFREREQMSVMIGFLSLNFLLLLLKKISDLIFMISNLIL